MAVRFTFAVLLAAALPGCAGAGAERPGDGPGIYTATSGAVSGAEIGRYLDHQARALGTIPGAQVQRRDDFLLVYFSDSILFQTGQARLQAGAYDRLRTLARTLNDYPLSQVIVKGHTDSSGADALNQRLSEGRAEQVRHFLIGENVDPGRLTSIGFGESMPVASNDTQVGRVQNRRVEIEIRPDAEAMQGG